MRTCATSAPRSSSRSSSVVADRLRAGLSMFRERHGKPTALVAAGGVAANEAIRKALHGVAVEAGTALVVPPPALCTDNGAMIAWAGAERLALGLTDTLATRAAGALAARGREGADAQRGSRRAAVARRAPAEPPRARRRHRRRQDSPSRHDARAHRRRRRRRLGHGAGERDRARRPQRDALHARPRRRRMRWRAARKPAPARRAARRTHRHRGDGERIRPHDAILLAVPAQQLRTSRARAGAGAQRRARR